MSLIPDILKAAQLPRIDIVPEIIAHRRDSILPVAINWARESLERQYGPDIAEPTDRVEGHELGTIVHDTGAEVVHLAQLRQEQEDRLAEIRRQVSAA